MVENIALTSALFVALLLIVPGSFPKEYDPPPWFKTLIVIPGFVGIIGLLVSLLILIWRT